MAPEGKWTCAPTSPLDPFTEAPPASKTTGLNLCGQCVSYVKKVCPNLPGTVVATFNSLKKYEGHAAIYVSQSKLGGILVYDQWVTPPSPKAVGPRTLRWGAKGRSNNGDNFYVVK